MCHNSDKLVVILLVPQEFVCKSEIRLKSPKSQNSRSSRRLEDLEFWLFGLFNRSFDLNTSSCAWSSAVRILYMVRYKKNQKEKIEMYKVD